MPKGKLGPTLVIREWLAAALVLRDAAVASRKARPDIFERVSTADSATTGVDEDELDEEVVDGSVPDEGVIETQPGVDEIEDGDVPPQEVSETEPVTE
jgi:hypothetical protein